MTINQYNVKFESDNIKYVQLDERLINDYLIMVNDREVQMQILGRYNEYTYDNEYEWVLNKLKEEAIVFSMIHKKNNEFIGNVEFMDVTKERAEIGISITPKYQDQHLGTEAMKTMIDYGFNKLGLNEIYLGVFSNNYRAIHCYKKLGFIEYEVKSNKDFVADSIYMRLVRKR